MQDLPSGNQTIALENLPFIWCSHLYKSLLSSGIFSARHVGLTVTWWIPHRSKVPHGYRAHSPAPGATRNCAASRPAARGKANQMSFSLTPASLALVTTSHHQLKNEKSYRKPALWRMVGYRCFLSLTKVATLWATTWFWFFKLKTYLGVLLKVPSFDAFLSLWTKLLDSHPHFSSRHPHFWMFKRKSLFDPTRCLYRDLEMRIIP